MAQPSRLRSFTRVRSSDSLPENQEKIGDTIEYSSCKVNFLDYFMKKQHYLTKIFVMQSRTANRSDFFIPGCCPIAVRTIQGDASMQHDGDLTDLRHTHDFAELIVIAGDAKTLD